MENKIIQKGNQDLVDSASSEIPQIHQFISNIPHFHHPIIIHLVSWASFATWLSPAKLSSIKHHSHLWEGGWPSCFTQNLHQRPLPRRQCSAFFIGRTVVRVRKSWSLGSFYWMHANESLRITTLNMPKFHKNKQVVISITTCHISLATLAILSSTSLFISPCSYISSQHGIWHMVGAQKCLLIIKELLVDYYGLDESPQKFIAGI